MSEQQPLTASLQIGERVRIHPACDWFMRGVTHGIITKKADTFAWVRPDSLGIHTPAKLRMRIPYALLCRATEAFPE